MENLYDLEADVKKSPNRIGDDWRKPLVPVLHDWLSALKPLGPDRQAAGLLAADRLLAVFGNIRESGLSVGDGQFGRPDSSSPAQAELRSKLEDLGAVIGQNETDDNL